jgi:hypothetical protein
MIGPLWLSRMFDGIRIGREPPMSPSELVLFPGGAFGRPRHARGSAGGGSPEAGGRSLEARPTPGNDLTR